TCQGLAMEQPFDSLPAVARSGPWPAMSEAAPALRLALSQEARSGHSTRPLRGRVEWRRRESNPRPKARPRGTLHACPLLISRAQREEAAKNRRAPDAVCLTIRRRAAV